MRTWLGRLLLASSLIAPSTPLSADDRKVFRFGNGDEGGAVINERGKRWVEVGSNLGARFDFNEISRTGDTIELRDPSRDVGLKLNKAHGELQIRNSPWGPWQKGRWVGIGDLPKSMQFMPVDQKIRLAYFVPKDREPIANYEQRIRVVMQLVADIYRRDLQAQGLHSEGFALETDSQGEPVVHLVRGQQNAQFYNDAPAFDQVKHYQRLMDEVPRDVGNVRRQMIVLFPETYEPGPAPIEWDGSIGMGAHFTADGGLAVMSAWILRDEFCAKSFDEQKKYLLDKTPIEGRTALGTRKPNSPRFEFIEDGFGAVAHELGHALGLPHDYRQPTDLMGHGFRSLQANYGPSSDKRPRIAFSRDNARLLGASRYLVSDLDLTDDVFPTADVSVQVLRIATPAAIISMNATDDRALRAVVFVDPQHDTVVGGAELKGREQTVKLKLPLKALKSGEFKLVALLADGGGNISGIATTEQKP